ncbi:MAG: hypothetical protein CMH36_00070 [Microbacterium sp.]|nr:hypothetical protein [Microbacterium sp.]
MGSNKRYGHHYDRLMDQRLVERAAATGGPLQSLSRAELNLDFEPVTRDPSPKPARAWVRFGATPVLVDAEVCSWTSSAIAICFTIAGTEHKAWVWAPAVTPLG